MTEKNSGVKSISYLILTLIPVANCIELLIVANKLKNIKLKKLSIAAIVGNAFLLLFPFAIRILYWDINIYALFEIYYNLKIIVPIAFAAFNVAIFVFAIIYRPKILSINSEQDEIITIRPVIKAQGNVQNQVQQNREQSNSFAVNLPIWLQLDINTATEEQFASLTGLTIVDAKKAVAYRNNKGSFNSIDEFFNCIKAKPHIIVKLQGQVFINHSH